MSRGVEAFQDHPPRTAWKKQRLEIGDRFRDTHSSEESRSGGRMGQGGLWALGLGLGRGNELPKASSHSMK